MHRTNRALVALAIGLLALVAGSTATATAASPANATQAATPGLAAGESDYLQCGGGDFCGWIDEVYNNYRYTTNTQQPNLASNGRPGCPGGTWDNCMSSLYNDTTYNYNAWTNPGFTGAAGFVEAGYYGGINGAGQPAGTRRTLTNVPQSACPAGNYNDCISSIQRGNATPPPARP